jgi:hypothetical protein
MRLFTFRCLLGVGFIAPMNQAVADSKDHSRPDNLSALTAEWWQWALSIPTGVNPLVDTTGSNCMVGQHGGVWFLAGVVFGGTAERTCSVPDDKFLFFPVANGVTFNSPNVCQDSNDISVPTLRQMSAASLAGITRVSAEFDGNSLRNVRRIRSDIFAVSLPEDNIFDNACPSGVPAGVYSPSVDDGFYVLLPPLDPGPHILHFRAVNREPQFTQDVTYHLNIQHVTVTRDRDKDNDGDRDR